METRIALIGMIIEDKESTPRLNAILHEYAGYIVGRMGIPNAKEGIAVISIVIDAPESVISALSGKLGMLPHVSAKTMYSRMP
jgi:putative iron-only hydrogenase system regulator